MNVRIYTYATALLLAFAASGCSNETLRGNEVEQLLPIEGIQLAMGQVETDNKAATRKTETGYSVNGTNDPTKADLATNRKDWLLDLALYNGNTKYVAGSFEEGTYNETNKYWIEPGKAYFFPNYLSPGAELLLYPAAKKNDKDVIAEDQSTDILLQDVLMQKNNSDGTRPLITPAHIIIKGKTDTKAEGINMVHKHAMLDFVISGINTADIEAVKVEVTAKGATSAVEYTPYEVTGLTGKKEYMLILPEDTDTDPVVTVTTKSGSEVDAIRYRQTVNIISSNKYPKLGTNNCFCFTLKGRALELSPITIVDWARGEAIQGEYIAVTAYPTFKAKGHEGETFYFYYDNKLKENGKEKLQKITFNQDGECTIKPDGRILTHIYTPAQTEEITPGGNRTPLNGQGGQLAQNIVLDEMIIDLENSIPVTP